MDVDPMTAAIKDEMQVFEEYKELASTERGKTELLVRVAVGVDGIAGRMGKVEHRLEGVEGRLGAVENAVSGLRKDHGKPPKLMQSNDGKNGRLKALGVVLGSIALILLGIMKAIGLF